MCLLAEQSNSEQTEYFKNLFDENHKPRQYANDLKLLTSRLIK